MMQVLAREIGRPGMSRQQLAAEIARPRRVWDSLSRYALPMPIDHDGHAAELCRSDVALSGPWGGPRGDQHERRLARERARVHHAVMGALGYYDWHGKPDFAAPSYEARRELARACEQNPWRCWDNALARPPIATLPWQCTEDGRPGGTTPVPVSCYDARTSLGGVTGSSPVTALADHGTRGFSASNGSSTFVHAAASAGALDALTATGLATDRLICASTAANHRLHYGDWVTLTVARVTDPSASRAIVSNRATSTSTTQLGLSVVNSADGYRVRIGNGATAVASPSVESVIPDLYSRAWVIGSAMTITDITMGARAGGVYGSFAAAHANAPVNSDAGVTNIGTGTAGGQPLIGQFMHFTMREESAVGTMISLVSIFGSLAGL